MIYNTTISIVLSVPILIAFDELPGYNKITISNEVWNAILISVRLLPLTSNYSTMVMMPPGSPGLLD